jgi:hypothetical protein
VKLHLPREWIELLGLLKKHRARFLVVGAYAVAVAGRPRATQDLDLFVEPTKANARWVCAALREFGYPALAGAEREFSKPGWMGSSGTSRSASIC